MPQIAISIDDLSRELAAFERKLASAYPTLSNLTEPTPGCSPRDLVFRSGKAALYRYALPGVTPTLPPMLIVYALVNRPYMADLQPDRSLIRGLLERGVDAYLIEWAYPDGSDRYKGLDEYINGELDACVEFLRREHRSERINLAGICQGGTFSLCYSALHPAKVRNLVTTVTPVDFHTPRDMLSHLLKYVDIDLLVDANGNVSGELLNTLFLSLKPFRLQHQKYLDLLEQLDDPAAVALFFRMEQWIFDSPDLAGAAFREFAQGCYRDNGLVRGSLRIGGRPVDLRNIVSPILNIFARDDHLVPREASQALQGKVGSADYTEVEVPGGHIGIYVGGKARALVAETVAQWLRARC